MWLLSERGSTKGWRAKCDGKGGAQRKEKGAASSWRYCHCVAGVVAAAASIATADDAAAGMLVCQRWMEMWVRWPAKRSRHRSDFDE